MIGVYFLATHKATVQVVRGKNLKRLLIIAACISLFIGLPAFGSPVFGEDEKKGEEGAEKKEIVARGKGITVYMSEINLLQEYMQDRGFSSSLKEYVRVLTTLKVFNKEAAKTEGVKKIVPVETDPIESKADIKKLFNNRQMYLAWLLRQIEVSDDAVLSLYRAYPERFEFAGRELDEELKETLKRKIAISQFRVVEAQHFEKLKKKYGIEIEE